MQLSIGELSKKTGVSVRAIRHYDKHKLLTSNRSCNGYRFFPEESVAQVRQIQRLIGAGFSIEEIRSFPDCMRLIEGTAFCPETQALQHKRLTEIEQQITELDLRKKRLIEMLSRDE